MSTSICRLVLMLTPALAAAEPPRTVAEKSGYQATSRHADVVAFCEQLAKLSPRVKLRTLGTSAEGRTLPLLVIADPPVADAGEARRSGRPVVLLFANIHAGEVDGKEALLMLARELATTRGPILEAGLVVLVVPNLNADGNEKLTKTNRPGQNGPELTGTRANAQGFDLNRDFVKLESPEVRALVNCVNEWDPAVLLDMHTTNGSFHRYLVTYDGPRHPAADARLVEAARDTFLPAIGKAIEGDVATFFYGNFSSDRSRWEMYPAIPRFGIQYLALRNRISYLCESYSYASFENRVKGSLAFARACLRHTADNKDRVQSLLKAAREETVQVGKTPRPSDQVALRHKVVSGGKKATVRGYLEEVKDGKRVRTNTTKDYEVDFMGRCEPTLSVVRPFAYLYPAALARVTENLQRHGIVVEEMREDLELDVEAYRVDRFTKAVRAFQKHNLVSAEATARKESRRVPAGTVLVRTGQPLGTLASFLLEPMSEDGLAAWNFFDDHLKEGQDFPVLRLPAAVGLLTGPVRPLVDERPREKKPITLKALDAGLVPSLAGTPTVITAWIDDEHFIQIRDGQPYRVQARTGRAAPLYDPDKYQRTLATVPGQRRSARFRSRSGFGLRMNPQRTGTLVEADSDLYFCPLDGSKATRLTKSDGVKELATFSPDGRWVAFVKDNNLYAVDLATQTERALTRDGSDTVFNGKADWVYYEELFGRSRHAFWWSPDSTHLAFLRLDDGPVKKFTLVDPLPTRQRLDTTPYPKAGGPNPLVKVGVVPVKGGDVRLVEPLPHVADSSLVVRVGWAPDGRVYFYLQDRAQTWLDFCVAGREGGKPSVLFRDTTRAWVEDPGAAHFLKDGSFLIQSERTGYKHIYHYGGDGKLRRPLTAGHWDVKTLHAVDESGGWVYFSGMRDNPIGTNLYRVRLDGTGLARLTPSSGQHVAQVSPKGGLFVDAWSDRKTPTRVVLRQADGAQVRTLDTNPVHAIDDFDFLPVESVQVRTPDGFPLEATVVAPPQTDPKRKFPVWLKTYGGPGMPSIVDEWRGGRVDDQALARAGYVVFRVDPRSASGKGACSAWTAYRQLGVQELKDLETAVKWIGERPYVDRARVGISGHSYGGFLAAYCLTHSKVFAAGIAGAPVTDWRNYDTIYTERYMNTPEENGDGYDRASVLKGAKDLHGRLLLAHGLMDDNVHFQNTAQFVDALQRADRDFEVMFYPRARHALVGAHYRRLTLEFMKRALKPEP